MTLLKRAERYARTDVNYLVQNGFWLGIKTVLAALLALLMSVAFANLLPVHTYGEYKYVLSVLGILSLTTLPGLGTSVVRSIAKGFDGTPNAVLATKIRWGFLGALGSAALAAYYFYAGNLTLAGAFAVASVFLPFVDTLSMFATVLSGKKLFKISIVYEIGIQLTAVCSISVALWYSDSLAIILGTYFLSYTVARYIAYTIVRNRYLTNDKVDLSALPHGIHLSIMETVATVSESVNALLLWFFIGPTQLALYAFAIAIPTQIVGGLKRIVTIALPKFAERTLTDIKKTLVRRLLLLWVGLFILFCLYVVVAPTLFVTLFPKYVDAIFYTQLYALTILCFPKKILGTVLNAQGRVKELYIHTLVTPFIKLFLAVWLIPIYGITGALTAEIASQVFAVLILGTLLIRTRELV